MLSILCTAVVSTPLSPAASTAERTQSRQWSDAERLAIESLWIGNLPELPASPGNPVADHPQAVAFGHRLFFDPRLSRDGTVACASCHDPSQNFKDGRARGLALGETRRKTMSIVGAAYSPWLFWDGRRDSLWAQALEPMEHADEHGGTRTHYARLLLQDSGYRKRYVNLFGPLPDLADSMRFPPAAGPHGSAVEQARWRAMSEADRRAVTEVFVNIGRVIEAYERRLIPAAAPFDRYVQTLRDDAYASDSALLDDDALAGLRLFIGKAQCTHCHNGPLFTNNEFHNTGLFPPDALPTDRGRVDGVQKLRNDPFNCLGTWSAATASDCEELRFVKTHGVELVAAFRTPSLRNIADFPPYMHTGEFTNLQQVLTHYNDAVPTLISDELEPLDLDAGQLRQIEAFLHTLTGPLATSEHLLAAPASAEQGTAAR